MRLVQAQHPTIYTENDSQPLLNERSGLSVVIAYCRAESSKLRK